MFPRRPLLPLLEGIRFSYYEIQGEGQGPFP